MNNKPVSEKTYEELDADCKHDRMSLGMFIAGVILLFGIPPLGLLYIVVSFIPRDKKKS